MVNFFVNVMAIIAFFMVIIAFFMVICVHHRHHHLHLIHCIIQRSLKRTCSYIIGVFRSLLRNSRSFN